MFDVFGTSICHQLLTIPGLWRLAALALSDATLDIDLGKQRWMPRVRVRVRAHTERRSVRTDKLPQNSIRGRLHVSNMFFLLGAQGVRNVQYMMLPSKGIGQAIDWAKSASKLENTGTSCQFRLIDAFHCRLVFFFKGRWICRLLPRASFLFSDKFTFAEQGK